METFSFHTTAPPHLSFTPSSYNPPPPQTRKRPRPLSDVDGLDSDIRDYSKKRRLRLKLITSRLSEPFAVPPTNILDRGKCSRVALCAKRRGVVASNVLRKAAILNKIKRDALAARAAKERQVEAARKEFRQRIAAAAQLSSRKNHVVLMHQPMDESAYIVRPGKMKVDLYDIPKHRRPPTPPSESELEWQRRGYGMGLGV